MSQRKMAVFIALLSILQIFGVTSKFTPRTIFNVVDQHGREDPAEYPPFTAKFEVPLNWFNATAQGSVDTHFNMRYILNDTNNKFKKGPIFFYAGNEGNIKDFYNASGFLTDTLAAEFGATVVFAEHRYYGDSLPFDDPILAFNKDNLRWLHVNQVLQDYINLLTWITNDTSGYNQNVDYPNERTPIYVFGGSYGGMLATWMRMKFPTIINGAVASSAPILWFEGATDPNDFYRVASNQLKVEYGQDCFDWQQQGFYDLMTAAEVPSTWHGLGQYFNICSSFEFSDKDEVMDLIDYVSTNLGIIAQHNYPYDTDTFGVKLPAHPLYQTCYNASGIIDQQKKREKKVGDARTFDYQNIERLSAMNEVMQYGKCFRPSKDRHMLDSGSLGWDIQTCSQIPRPIGSDPANSAYTWSSWFKKAHTGYCQKKWGLTPQYDWIPRQFGGSNPEKDFNDYRNILFVNGRYDPWQGGGVTQNITFHTRAIFVDKAAHHYDLRMPHPMDTPAIKSARDVERFWINKWISEFASNIF